MGPAQLEVPQPSPSPNWPWALSPAANTRPPDPAPRSPSRTQPASVRPQSLGGAVSARGNQHTAACSLREKQVGGSLAGDLSAAQASQFLSTPDCPTAFIT